MHPLYNPSDLSDDKIHEKLTKAYLVRAQQEQLGHDPTVASIDHAIMALEMEKAKRFEVIMAKEAEKKKPEEMKPITLGILDTDPEEKKE